MGRTGADNLLLALMMGFGAVAIGALLWVLWRLLCGFWIWLAEFGAVLLSIMCLSVCVIAVLAACGLLG